MFVFFTIGCFNRFYLLILNSNYLLHFNIQLSYLLIRMVQLFIRMLQLDK